ncbi:WhiB family transcriptional regulator [Aquipuribacter nitratireducens]|uniref:Transcriptional regulator WhiB n=1 Tax=Aquipuribacter nitratireducens TaxID=650104 RepID=A0ABW0GK39_9MICO
MALPMIVGEVVAPLGREDHRREVDELTSALRGAEARATPPELAPLDEDEDELDALDDDGLDGLGGLDDLAGIDLPPGTVVEGGAVVLPLLPGGRSPAPDWKDRALCAETDPEAFFPEKGGSTREAKKVCSSCDVRAECLDFALGNDERFGIWGGLSERERRRLKKRVV